MFKFELLSKMRCSFSKSFLCFFDKNLSSYSCISFMFAVSPLSGKKPHLSFFSGYCTMKNYLVWDLFCLCFCYPRVFLGLCTIHKNRISVQLEKRNILLYRNISLCLFSVFSEGLLGIQLLKNLWVWFQLLNYC